MADIIEEKESHVIKNMSEIPSNSKANAGLTLDEIYEFVKREYGDDMLDAFKKRLSGYTISELEKETNKKGLNYMINKILKRIREVFK